MFFSTHHDFFSYTPKISDFRVHGQFPKIFRYRTVLFSEGPSATAVPVFISGGHGTHRSGSCAVRPGAVRGCANSPAVWGCATTRPEHHSTFYRCASLSMDMHVSTRGTHLRTHSQHTTHKPCTASAAAPCCMVFSANTIHGSPLLHGVFLEHHAATCSLA